MKYLPTIGLEIHSQLNTRTKMFCGSLNDPEETRPNVNVCPVCLAHPGTLPVANQAAIEKVVAVGLALGCTIREKSWFERKNYFYPDLPKGYQISQYEAPLCENGELKLSSGKVIRIRRIHLEEDTGRLIHSKDETLVDFNRAGVPLMELVTEPDIETAQEAKEFGEEFQLLLRYLNVSGADMEKGQLRLEANISVRPESQKELGTKVEVKNINSFRAMERAAMYEIERQSRALDAGEKIVQETRGWNEQKQQTVSQRSKEESHDYRYFPEPDLPPVVLIKENIEEIRRDLPELPWQKRERFVLEYGITAADAQVLTFNRDLGDYFEHVVSELGVEKADKKTNKLAANYLITEVQKLITNYQLPITQTKITPENFAELILMVGKGKVSSSGAQAILYEMFETGGDPSTILEEKGLTQISDEGEIEKAAQIVISENPDAVADYKNGKEAALKYLVGQLMAATRGSANPQVAAEVLKKVLG